MKIEEKRFEAVREYLEEVNPEAMLFDGLEDALVGTCDRIGQPTLAAYDYDKCIEILAKDMTDSDDDDLSDSVEISNCIYGETNDECTDPKDVDNIFHSESQ